MKMKVQLVVCAEDGREEEVHETALANTSFTLVGNELDLVWETSA